MPRTAAATLQTVWDCRWSRPGYRIAGVEDQFQPESFWVCVRTGERRCLKEDDCVNCPYWEELPERPLDNARSGPPR